MHPETPPEGQSLEALFPGRTLQLEEMRRHLMRVAEMENLTLSDGKMIYNSRLAQELGKWAESRGIGNEFHNGVFRAYFAEGKNIGKDSELLLLAQSIGLPEEEAQDILINRSFREAVDGDWDYSRRMGVTAVPTFKIDSQKVVGAQPYEVLDQFMKTMGVKERPSGSYI